MIIKAIISLITALLVLITGSTASVIGFTDGTPIMATRQSYGYDNSKLLLGAYNCNTQYSDRKHMQYIKDAGIDFVITSVTEDFLDACDELGIGVIAKSYNLPALYYDVPESARQQWLNFLPSQYKNHPSLWGDDLIDEPSSVQFEKLGEIVNKYYSYAPGKIPLINLFPMYANSEQLGNESAIPNLTKNLMPYSDYSDEQIDRYKRHVSDYINKIDTDYISVDIYPMRKFQNRMEVVDLVSRSNAPTDDSWLRNLDILAEACRETNRDLWVIIQSAGNIQEGGKMRYCHSKPDLMQQAYASLAFGAKAIIYACYQTGWWDTDSHLVDANGNRTATYYATQEVNKDLSAISEIYGDYQYKGTYLKNDLLAAGHLYGLHNGLDKKEELNIATTSGLLVGCFDKIEGSGNAYVITNMMELDHDKTAEASVLFPKDKKVTVYQNGEKKVSDSSLLRLTLTPGEGIFVSVE